MECCNDCIKISALSNCPKHSMTAWWTLCSARTTDKEHGSLSPLEKPVFASVLLSNCFPWPFVCAASGSDGLSSSLHLSGEHCTTFISLFVVLPLLSSLPVHAGREGQTKRGNQREESDIIGEVTEPCRVAHLDGIKVLSWIILGLSLCSKGLERGGDALSGLLLFYLVCVLL